MAFINVEEALPKENGVYRVMIDAINQSAYEAEAKWVNGKGFQLLNEKLDNNRYITSWWVEDNIR